MALPSDRVKDVLLLIKQNVKNGQTFRNISVTALLATILLTSAVAGALLIPTATTESQTASATFPGTNGKIAFTSDRDGNREIYVMNADGTEQTRLTDNTAADEHPIWSPDATKLSFTSDRDGNQEIYVMNADGSGQTRLTNNPGADFFGSWSSDGSKIALTSFAGDIFSPALGDIYVMNADGSSAINLTNNDDANDVFGSWSPDETKIAFSSNRSQTDPRHVDDIFVMNADGTQPVKLTDISAVAPGSVFTYSYHSPLWSADGSKIVFSLGYALFPSIWVMNADGSGQTQIGDTSVAFGPNLSPDGSSITFIGSEIRNPSGYAIHAMNADGTGPTRLTDKGDGFDPSWSPDSTKIAFRSFKDSGSEEIYTMNADGSGPTRLTYNNATDDSPDWGVKSVLTAPSAITVNARSLDGSIMPRMWVTVNATDGTAAKTGFTPLTFVGSSGTGYRVMAANYDGQIFHHWEDQSTNHERTINMTSDRATITAYYDLGDSLRGFSPLTYEGVDERPNLTVNTVRLDGLSIDRMWTIIDPQSSNGEGTTYKVYASSYKDILFDHWEDGSVERVRTLTTGEDTTITAYYRIEFD